MSDPELLVRVSACRGIGVSGKRCGSCTSDKSFNAEDRSLSTILSDVALAKAEAERQALATVEGAPLVGRSYRLST